MSDRNRKTEGRPRASERSPEQRAMIEGTVGIWINKRSVTFLDLPFRHRLVGEATGWRIEILEPGKVLVHGRKDERGIDVEEGDFLVIGPTTSHRTSIDWSSAWTNRAACRVPPRQSTETVPANVHGSTSGEPTAGASRCTRKISTACIN